jgi:hypothetical protein
LKIAMETLPDLAKTQSVLPITRLALYNEFVDQWYKRAKKRLQ